METTDSGLIVPDGTLKLKRAVWTRDLAQKIEKLAELLDDSSANVQLLFVCELCREKGKPSGCIPSINPLGEIILTCSCTARRLSRDKHV